MSGATRVLAALFLAALCSAVVTGAQAQNARVSGQVRRADTKQPITKATVKIEGAPLASRENSQIARRVNTQGTYQLEVPAVNYDVWVGAPDFEEVKVALSLAAGSTSERNFELQPLAPSYAYRVETVRSPQQMIPEVSGVSFTPRGTLVITNRRGEVWMRDRATERWRRFAAGLYEGFGLVALDESEVLVIQRPELTRLTDSDSDGVADRYETIGDRWGITGNYHEFTYGLARDSAGNIYFGSGMVSYGQSRDLPWVRGTLKTDLHVPWTGKGPVPDGHRSVAEFQGWTFQVSPRGQLTPFASGFRQPLGVGVSPADELFVTDVSGAWVPTSTLMHVEKDGFYGHPDPLKWHPEFKDRHLTREELQQMRRPPAAYLPRGLMGTSPGQPVWDTTGGRFGPFAGQIFLGDVSSLVMRVALEKVGGAYQGAAFPFLRGHGLRLGGMHNAFGPDGALYIAQTVRGWMSTEGNEGIQRIRWTGEAPVDIETMRLTERGFALRFTQPMTARAADAGEYRVRRFQYNYHSLDGSLRMGETDVPIAAARLGADGRSLELELAELQPAYIYELKIGTGVASASGRPLLNPIAYYTANRLLSGQSQPGPTKLVIAQAAPLQPADIARGAEIFRLNCMVCHQADGKGSPQAGTPDYTANDSPLRKPDEELVAIIVNGKVQPDGKMMPPFGNVLPPQAIHDVLAYLRATFLPSTPKP
jgi:mono/diheme cytochrome c family protein